MSPQEFLSSASSKAVTAALLAVAWPLADAASQTADEETQAPLEEIVVTGTSVARTALFNPSSVTRMDAEALRRFSFSSQADILRKVPGIKAEGGGGEVAANVFIRGLPSGGQFQFTPLQYDGIDAFSQFGLNSSAFDVYVRNDLGVERMEFVRGGVSNLFGSGSVAGIVNYISKTGGEDHEGITEVVWADEGRFRGDFAVNGPLGNNFYYAMSGYYRNDEGPLESGFDSEGFQLRGNIVKEFDDGSGFFKILWQAIDDEVQFFLPLPLDGETRKRARGNDGRTVYTVQTDAAKNLSFQTPDGVFRSDIEDGVDTEGGLIGFAFEKTFDNGWGINGRTKYANYDHQFNLFLDGDGVVNTPETLGGFLDARDLPGLENAAFTFTDSGQAVPQDFLLFANRILDRDRPAEDFTLELNVTKDLRTGGLEHRFTLGGFFARAEADDRTHLSTFLAEFNDEPRLVDLTVTDPDTGVETVISRNGLINAGAGFSNDENVAKRFAVYFADQIEAGRLAIDMGVRVEKLDGDISTEMSEVFEVDFGVNDTDLNLAPALTNVVFGNGDFLFAEPEDTAWAASGAILYELADNLTVFGNFSRGFFFPQLRAVQFNDLGEPGRFDAEVIKLSEFGFKYGGSALQASVTGFWTKLSNRLNVDFVNQPDGSVDELVDRQGTRTFGLEANVDLFLGGLDIAGPFGEIADYLTVSGNVTAQDTEFTVFENNPQFLGNEPRRQPNLLFNTGLTYDDGTVDIALAHAFTGDNFANDSNSVELESFHLVNLTSGYRLRLDNENTVRIGLAVFNLTDSDGITEGSPRQAREQEATGQFFVGRPVLPRRFTVSVRYEF